MLKNSINNNLEQNKTATMADQDASGKSGGGSGGGGGGGGPRLDVGGADIKFERINPKVGNTGDNKKNKNKN